MGVAGGKGKDKLLYKGYKISVLQDRVKGMGGGDCFTTVWMYLTSWTVFT